MATQLLFVILICYFHEIKVQALARPKLIVNQPVITKIDSVTLNCQTPSSSVSQCYFYTLGGNNVRAFPCLKTMPGTELLLMAAQSSPAEVEVKCYYTMLEESSPHSDISSIIINLLHPPKLTVNPSMITETDSVRLNCETPSSVSVSQCYFYTGGSVRAFPCLKTLTGTELLRMAAQSSPAVVKVKCSYTMKEENSPHSDTSSITVQSKRLLLPSTDVTGAIELESRVTQTSPTFTVTTETPSTLTVSRPQSFTPVTLVKLTSGQTVGTTTFTTSVKRPSGTSMQTFVIIVTGCGVTVVVIMLILAVLTKRKTAVSDEVKGLENQLERESKNKNTDTYHLYCTVSEEPAALVVRNMIYQTVQAH